MPTDPTPAPPAVRPTWAEDDMRGYAEMLEQRLAALSMPTTQGEMTREEMVSLITKLHHKLAHPNERIRELESALTAVREERDQMFHSLTAERKERDRYERALVRLRDCDWVISLPDRMDAVREIAHTALMPPVSDRQPEGETK